MDVTRMRIMIVEDEAAHAEAIRRAFEAAGTDAEIQVSGTLREYRESVAASAPDIALVDLNLPDGRAVEVLTSPSEAGPFPILIMTGYGTEQVAVEAMRSGALDYIVKSSEAFADMPRTVARALREWNALQERKRAEQELHESEERYRSLVEAAPDVIYTVSAEDGSFTSLNPAFETLTGWSRAEWLGKPLMGIVHPDDLPLAIETFQKASRGETHPPYELRVLSKSGEYLVGEFTSTPHVKDGKVVGELGIARDITKRKRAEEALGYRLEFEKLVASISTQFISTAADDIPSRMSDTLSRIAQFVSADRSYILLFSNDETTIDNVYEWCAEGIEPHLHRRKEVSVGAFPWLMEKMKQSQTLCIRRVADLPHEAGAEKELLQEGAVQSAVAVPMVLGGKVIGILGFDSVRQEKAWSEDIILSLRIVGQILADVVQRKRAEEALRESEERFRTLFDQASESIVLIDGETGALLEFNDKAHENLGYTREEFEKLRIADFEVLESADEVAKHIENIVKGGGDTFETKYATKDGEARDILVSSRAISIRGEKFVQSIWYDITDRKRGEEVLHESEERFRLAFENANIGMCLVSTAGRLIRINSMMCEIVGYGREELEGISVNDITHADDLDVTPAFIRHALFGGIERGRFTKRYSHKDGHVVWGRVSSSLVRDTEGVPLYFISHVQDITQRKQAEAALQTSEKRFRALIEHSMDGIALGDKDGTIQYFPSPATAHILGYGMNELVGRSIFELVHPDDLQRATGLFAQLLEKLSGPLTVQLRYRHKDGSWRWLECVISNLLGEPSLRAVVVNYRDITERKQAEERLMAYQENLRSLASELSLAEERERRRIASYLHDEIGQSLAAIRMKFGAVRQAGSSAEIAGMVDEIQTLLEWTIRDTRSLTVELSPPILYELGLEAALEWLSERIGEEHGIRIEFADDAHSKPLEDDVRGLLFRAVDELLINIVKHANTRSGRVSILRDGDHVRIVVEDDGVGFDATTIESRTSRDRGFGLFSVRERLRYIGGHIEVESERGHGTRVTLIAPLSRDRTSLEGGAPCK